MTIRLLIFVLFVCLINVMLQLCYIVLTQSVSFIPLILQFKYFRAFPNTPLFSFIFSPFVSPSLLPLPVVLFYFLPFSFLFFLLSFLLSFPSIPLFLSSFIFQCHFLSSFIPTLHPFFFSTIIKQLCFIGFIFMMTFDKILFNYTFHNVA